LSLNIFSDGEKNLVTLGRDLHLVSISDTSPASPVATSQVAPIVVTLSQLQGGRGTGRHQTELDSYWAPSMGSEWREEWPKIRTLGQKERLVMEGGVFFLLSILSFLTIKHCFCVSFSTL
jgi:hypothetical protein